MMPQTPDDALDRHALVSAVWLPSGFVALGLFTLALPVAGPGGFWRGLRLCSPDTPPMSS